MRRRIDIKDALQQQAAPAPPPAKEPPPAPASKPTPSMFDDDDDGATKLVAGFADSFNEVFADTVRDARQADEEAAREDARTKLKMAAATNHIKSHPVEGIGRTIAVTMGRELFSPVQYTSFEVGPISVTTGIEHGETIGQAYARLRADLTAIFKTEYDIKIVEFLERMKASKGR